MVLFKKATEWTLYDRKRTRGRPKKRWEDEIRYRVGINWEREDWDREIWRMKGEAYKNNIT